MIKSVVDFLKVSQKSHVMLMLHLIGCLVPRPQARYLEKEYTALPLEDILKEIALDSLDTDTKEWLRGVGGASLL